MGVPHGLPRLGLKPKNPALFKLDGVASVSKSKAARPQKKPSKTISARRKSTPRRVSTGGTAIEGDVTCADFIGRDQVTITYGYTAADLERLVDKVLAFLQAGATFIPRVDARGEALKAKMLQADDSKPGWTISDCSNLLLIGRNNCSALAVSRQVIWNTMNTLPV